MDVSIFFWIGFHVLIFSILALDLGLLNKFAILGLRSLYFAVSGIMGYFRYLKVGLAFVLKYVGIKMLAAYFNFEISILLSLSIIISILVFSILASIIIKKKYYSSDQTKRQSKLSVISKILILHFNFVRG